jgi:ribosomal protein S18 acetylase RimI-like enzyme
MMLVDPRLRRAGIGAKLLDRALSELPKEICVRLDATPAGEPLYRRAGFVDEYSLARLRGRARLEYAVSSPMNIRPMEPDDLPRVDSSDLEAFGADRSALLHSLYRRAPEYAWVAMSGKTLHGYLFGRQGFLYQYLGPLIAQNSATARQLLGHCLAANAERVFVIDTPLRDEAWTESLKSAGFVLERSLFQMRRGHLEHPGNPDFCFGIAGPEFG